MLEVGDLKVATRAGHDLVHGISFTVAPGEWLALIGESGSGKSVTAHAVGDLLPDTLTRSAERLTLGDADLRTCGPRRMRRILGARICYVFQNYEGAFSPYYRIGRHMHEALSAHRSVDRGQARQIIATALEEVSLDPDQTMNRYPFQLSGGQMQRVVLATALMLKPELLIADEPTTALDGMTQVDVLARIDDLRTSTGCAVLFITHDLRCVVDHADRVAVMRHGRIVEDGVTDEVVAAPKEAYTRNLFASVPAVDKDLDRLPTFNDQEAPA